MVIVVMGVTGSGKTTVGQRLAFDLRWPFFDADEFHPQENVDRMRQGIPLTDEDRAPWLTAIRTKIDQVLDTGGSAVIGCSALKRAYRRVLGEGRPSVHFVYLRGSEALIGERLRHRVGHFMNPRLLGSQFETLEEPESALVVDVALPLAAQVRRIRQELGIDAPAGRGSTLIALLVAAAVSSFTIAESARTAAPPAVECAVPDDPESRVFRLEQAEGQWRLSFKSRETDGRWIRLALPSARPVADAGRVRLSYRNANGGRQIDLSVTDAGSSLDVWVDYGLEVNIEPDLDPRVDLMNTEGPLEGVHCLAVGR